MQRSQIWPGQLQILVIVMTIQYDDDHSIVAPPLGTRSCGSVTPGWCVWAIHIARDKKESQWFNSSLEDCKSQRPVTDFSGECLDPLMTCLLSGLGLVNPRIVQGRLFLVDFHYFFLGTCFDVCRDSSPSNQWCSISRGLWRDVTQLESNIGLTSNQRFVDPEIY